MLVEAESLSFSQQRRNAVHFYSQGHDFGNTRFDLMAGKMTTMSNGGPQKADGHQVQSLFTALIFTQTF